MIDFLDSADAVAMIESIAADLVKVPRHQRLLWLDEMSAVCRAEMPRATVEELIERVALCVAERELGHASLSTLH